LAINWLLPISFPPPIPFIGWRKIELRRNSLQFLIEKLMANLMSQKK